MNEPTDYDPTVPPAPPAPQPVPQQGYAAPPYGGGYAYQSCMNCGYNLQGLRPGGTCPECGAPLPPPVYGGRARPTNGLAITSMVLGICSIPACLFYGLPAILFGAVGLVFARLARKQQRTGQYADSSAGFTQAGFICSLIGLILGLVYMVVIVVFIVVMVKTAPPPGSHSPYNNPNSPSSPSYPQYRPSNPGVPGAPGNASALHNTSRSPYTPGTATSPFQNTPHGLDSQGRPSLPRGVEYAPNGRVRPSLPSGVEYGPNGRVQPATPGGFPSPASPRGPSPF